jgi:hypothetical protein
VFRLQGSKERGDCKKKLRVIGERKKMIMTMVKGQVKGIHVQHEKETHPQRKENEKRDKRRMKKRAKKEQGKETHWKEGEGRNQP